MTWAAVLLAASVLAIPRVPVARMRTGPKARDHARRHVIGNDPLAAAASLDVLAACLRSGMTVSGAAAGAAESAPPTMAALLRRAADLLTLGADPAAAWANPVQPAESHLQALTRMARRSECSGTALAQGVGDLAAQLRAEAAAGASAKAERANVLIAGPLGLCYLPAFLCLGVVPVVAGLAGEVLRSGVL
ncbi:MAG: type II secretion system F family protein [Actinomycetia bacterium]|nr:type II secretion system F family protein [Actinomycetes bacterium]MCH9700317.1 type II secretion system F family protein [Actinomycetes bacterium]MCH9760563.1 type II secretion system F family protein [Actinomycetes bacterium]